MSDKAIPLSYLSKLKEQCDELYKIEPNPTSQGTEELSKVKIHDTVYNILGSTRIIEVQVTSSELESGHVNKQLTEEQYNLIIDHAINAIIKLTVTDYSVPAGVYLFRFNSYVDTSTGSNIQTELFYAPYISSVEGSDQMTYQNTTATVMMYNETPMLSLVTEEYSSPIVQANPSDIGVINLEKIKIGRVTYLIPKFEAMTDEEVDALFP